MSNKRNRQKVQENRNNKKYEQGHRVVREKFQEQRIKQVKPLQAKTLNQKETLRAFNKYQMVIQSGFAGTGKSELMCWYAAKLWLEGKIDNIVITRPHQHLGQDYGATKGNDAEKLLPFCMSMLMKLKKYLGVGILSNNFKLDGFDTLFAPADGIQIVPIEKIQGLSFSEKTIILADEIQNATVAQVKALTTRCEEGCQLLISGDPRQTAIGKNNGLNFIENVLLKYPTEYAKTITYGRDDVVRGGLAGHLVSAFDEMNYHWEE